MLVGLGWEVFVIPKPSIPARMAELGSWFGSTHQLAHGCVISNHCYQDARTE